MRPLARHDSRLVESMTETRCARKFHRLHEASDVCCLRLSKTFPIKRSSLVEAGVETRYQKNSADWRHFDSQLHLLGQMISKFRTYLAVYRIAVLSFEGSWIGWSLPKVDSLLDTVVGSTESSCMMSLWRVLHAQSHIRSTIKHSCNAQSSLRMHPCQRSMTRCIGVSNGR